MDPKSPSDPGRLARARAAESLARARIIQAEILELRRAWPRLVDVREQLAEIQAVVGTEIEAIVDRSRDALVALEGSRPIASLLRETIRAALTKIGSTPETPTPAAPAERHLA